MLEYFRGSQLVKDRILDDGIWLDKILEILTDEGEVIGEGLHNRVYRLGRTKEGIHLALRTPMFHTPIHLYENYCQVAALRSSQYREGRNHFLTGKPTRPVNFCIGVVHDEMPSLITEDVTEGGKYELGGRQVVEHVDRLIDDVKMDQVLVDLDIPSTAQLAEYHWEELNLDVERPEYFAKENRIDL